LLEASWKEIELEKMDYIIPTWNSGATLEITLSSIERFGNHNKIIIVDRNSTDDTNEIAEKHKCDIIKCNSSLGAARMAGAKRARTDLVGFVDSDVELKESWQNLIMHAQNIKYSDAGIFGAYYEGSLPRDTVWPLVLEGGSGAFGCIIVPRSHVLECTDMERYSSAEDGALSKFLYNEYELKWYIFAVPVLHHQDTNISSYARMRWAGAGLRVREGFKLANVKRIIGGALFGIRMNDWSESYVENWRVRWNYFIGYVRYKKYYEIDRSKL
jgi:glycosyltransferase involved in cell wall biosynthesis